MKSLDQLLAFVLVILVTGIWCLGLVVALKWLIN
jgi:hypothetical protein